MIVAYVNNKGGVGKTTLAIHHAVWAFDRGLAVALLDADADGLSSAWTRKAEPGVTVRRATTPAETQKALRSLSRDHDLVVCDGPAGIQKQTIVLLDNADLALIPVMASTLDMQAAWHGARELVAAIHRRHPGRPEVRFVLNGLDRRTKVAREILDFAARQKPRATKSHIRRLSQFVEAANESVVTRMGKRASEARRDIDSLFTELRRAANE